MAGEGYLAQAMSGFLKWMAPQYEWHHKELPEKVQHWRDRIAAKLNHRRAPTIVANLLQGWSLFLEYALEAEALEIKEFLQLNKQGFDALIFAAKLHGQDQDASEPAIRLIELLKAAIANGSAHLASAKGRSPALPHEPQAWGWRERNFADGNLIEWQPQGVRIGWVEGDDVYLNPDTAISAARKLSQSSGDELVLSPKTLSKRLKEKGFLRSTDSTRQTLTVRRTLEGKRVEVLHLHSNLFLQTEPDQSDQLIGASIDTIFSGQMRSIESTEPFKRYPQDDSGPEVSLNGASKLKDSE